MMKWPILSFLCVIAVSTHALKCEKSFLISQWMSFQDAKDFIQSEGITNQSEFQAWSKSGKRPKNFPSNPYKTYEDEWISWYDFLGTEKILIPNIKKEWMSFQDAKTFIQSEGFQTSTEFYAWSKSVKRPKNFPSRPDQFYKDEWTNWYDFLGTEKILIPNIKKEWMSFQDAKIFIQQQGVISVSEFQVWSKSVKRPKNFPSNPNQVYKDEWTNWYDFLGTGNKKEWMSFQDAKTFIQSQGIQTSTEFQAWSTSGERPKNFPSAPWQVYQNEWISWGDFLGTSNKKEWMSFQDAKTFIQSQGFQTSTEFYAWSKSGKRPKNFHRNPYQFYKDEWTNWDDFLGTRKRNRSSNKKKWMSFQDAKTFIQSQGLQTRTEFYAWSASEERPQNFPSFPRQVYQNEWISWGDFLGTGNTAPQKREWMTFQNAKTFIQSQGITSESEFQAWKRAGKRPKNFPSNPEKTYKDEWTNWDDFLGTRKRNRSSNKKEWMSFQDAQNFIQNQGIQTSTEFRAWSKSGKRPKNFPSAPWQVYIDEWTNWNDFLGTKKPFQGEWSTFSNEGSTFQDEWMSFQDAKDFIQQQGIISVSEFEVWSKSSRRPQNFPPSPIGVYANKWNGWSDFLGTDYMKDRTDNKHTEIQEYMSYTEAKNFVQQLRIKTPIDFFEIQRNEPDIFPENFPPKPRVFYTNTGEWIDWNDFLELPNTSQEKKNSSKQAQGFIDWLKSQENTDENIEIEDDQNVEGNLTNDFTDEELDAEKDFTDGFPNEEPDIEKYF